MIDLACALHVHSRYSDGTGSIREIAAAARGAALDVVLITDHDTLAGRAEEGWYDGTLVLVGCELSPKRRDHYLVFGLDECPAHDRTDAVEMCARVDAAGGFGFAAHPLSRGAQLPVAGRFAKPQRWADLEGPCLTGIEIWNIETEGAERARTPRELMRFLRDPVRCFPEPDPRLLAEWDRLGASRPVVGVAGLDAHQKGLRLARAVLSPLPYGRLFAHARTHVLVDRPLSGAVAADRQLVFAALRAGHCYVALDVLAPACGFRFEARSDSRRLAMGEEAQANEGWTLVAETPAPAQIELLRDGCRIAAAAGDQRLEHSVERPGVYRVEARLAGRLWLLSNPVYLR